MSQRYKPYLKDRYGSYTRYFTDNLNRGNQEKGLQNKAVTEKYLCLRRPLALLENRKTRFADSVKSREF